MKFRVVIAEDNIQIVECEQPQSVGEFVNLIKEKCNITGTLCIQYVDPEFNDYINLMDVESLKDKMTIKINLLNPESNSDTGNENSTTGLRGECWPIVFPVPKFDVDIELWLAKANSQYKANESLSDIPRDMKSRLLYRVASTIYDYTAYINQMQCKDVAQALIKSHPGLRSPAGQGWETWQNSIAYKMSNFRGEIRKLGSKEVTLNGNRKSTRNPLGGNNSGLAPSKNIKKPKRGEVNLAPDLPSDENEESQEKHREALIQLTASCNPNKENINRLMALTYAHRRDDVNNQLPIPTLFTRWPALSMEGQVSMVQQHNITPFYFN